MEGGTASEDTTPEDERRRFRRALIGSILALTAAAWLLTRLTVPVPAAPYPPEAMADPVDYRPPEGHELFERAQERLVAEGSARFEASVWVDGRRLQHVRGTTAPGLGQAVWRADIDGRFGHTHGMLDDRVEYRYRRDRGWTHGVADISLSDPLGGGPPTVAALSRFDLLVRHPWREHLLREIGADIAEARRARAPRPAAALEGESVTRWELELAGDAVDADLRRGVDPEDVERALHAWFDDVGRLRRVESVVVLPYGIEQTTVIDWSDFGVPVELYRRW